MRISSLEKHWAIIFKCYQSVKQCHRCLQCWSKSLSVINIITIIGSYVYRIWWKDHSWYYQLHERKLCVSKENSFAKVLFLRLYLVSPATSLVSERSSSTMWLIKNWLRGTMKQDLLNHAMLLSIDKKDTDKLDLIEIANMKEMTKDNVFLVYSIKTTWSNALKLTDFFYVEVPIFRKRSFHAIWIACLWKVASFIQPDIFGNFWKQPKTKIVFEI